MNEIAAEYKTATDEEPRLFHCKACGAELGFIRRRQHDGIWITYLDRWGDRIYHGDILCPICGRLETWSMNLASFEALMENYIKLDNK